MRKYTSATIGYSYDGGIFCPSCLRRMAARECEAMGYNAEFQPLDNLLTTWAEIVGIEDLDDESSYDSHDFPKMILDAKRGEEICFRCDETLDS